MERNTNRFWWMALPALLALMALPQLFYFWLAPAMAAASWLVHGVGTVLTLALPLYACLLCWRYGLRRAAGAAALAGAAQAFTNFGGSGASGGERQPAHGGLCPGGDDAGHSWGADSDGGCDRSRGTACGAAAGLDGAGGGCDG